MDSGAKPKVHTPTRNELHLQRYIAWALLLPFSGTLVLLLKYGRGYRIKNHAEVRRQFREFLKSTDKPIMICANHLSFIDSALIIWALASKPWYALNFRRLSWNLPAGDFFKKKAIYRLVAYLTKCIFIHRDGSREHQYTVLEHVRWLLERGEIVTVFPEGRRSRTGRIEMDKLTYGVGKIISEMKECQVLCVYLRGDRQEDGHANYPAKNSTFHLEMKPILVKTSLKGREAYAEVTHQIASTLKEMELRYFANRPQTLTQKAPATPDLSLPPTEGLDVPPTLEESRATRSLS